MDQEKLKLLHTGTNKDSVKESIVKAHQQIKDAQRVALWLGEQTPLEDLSYTKDNFAKVTDAEEFGKISLAIRSYADYVIKKGTPEQFLAVKDGAESSKIKLPKAIADDLEVRSKNARPSKKVEKPKPKEVLKRANARK